MHAARLVLILRCFIKYAFSTLCALQPWRGFYPRTTGYTRTSSVEATDHGTEDTLYYVAETIMDKRKKVFSVFGVKKEKRKAIDRSTFFKEKSSSQLVVPFEIFLQSSYIYTEFFYVSTIYSIFESSWPRSRMMESQTMHFDRTDLIDRDLFPGFTFTTILSFLHPWILVERN